MQKLIMPFLYSLIALVALNCTNRSLVTNSNEAYPFQEKVLEYVFGDSIPKNGGYIYYWPKDNDSTFLGTTKEINYLGTVISKVRENKGTHCVGVSWQVAMSVLQTWSKQENTEGKISNLSVEEVKDFADKWFVKLKGAPLAAPQEMGAIYALTHYNLGKQIPFAKAQAGDFVQFWRRDGSGHSCIFLNWVYNSEGEIIGFNYWGSQPTTFGIGTKTEYFYPDKYALKPEKLLEKKRFYVGRLQPGQ